MKISCLKETVAMLAQCCYRKRAVILTAAVPALLHTQPDSQVMQQEFCFRVLLFFFFLNSCCLHKEHFWGMVSLSDKSASGSSEMSDFIYLIVVNGEYSISANGSRAGSPRPCCIRLRVSLGEQQIRWCLELIQLQ